jgi:outer membrane immunogenic protein
MGFSRALAFVTAATLGLGVQVLPAAAHGPAADDYSPYGPSGFFQLDWSGLYAGAHLGGANANAESSAVLFPDNPVLTQINSFGQSENSLTGGVQAGWQRQWGKLVAGVEAGFTVLRFDTTSDPQLLPGLVSDLVEGLTRSVELSNIFTLTGRLGYTDGRWLAYAKGGLANADVDVTYRDAIRDATSSESGRETGWTAGVGVDYALTPSLFLGVEYNFIHFSANVAPPPIPETQFDDVEIDVQNIVVRLNYRFGSGCCPAPAGPP